VSAAIGGLFPMEEVVVAAVVAAAMDVTGVRDFRLAVPGQNVTAGEGQTFAAGAVRVLPLEWDGTYGL
jgi:hypothetical protein